MKNSKKVTILIADDDDDDRLMTREAFEEVRILNEIFFVKDGVELIDYLFRKGKFESPDHSPRPGLILLDLNMPRMDGLEALNIIKKDHYLRSIPVTIFTTSKAEEDIVRSYNLGVNCFITKPVTYTGLVEVVRQLNSFWFELVELPAESKS
ncbi:MAG: response regulator [Saprospiraceae bacterium]|nr:response regulator [Saprospiraceae bacterium]